MSLHSFATLQMLQGPGQPVGAMDCVTAHEVPWGPSRTLRAMACNLNQCSVISSLVASPPSERTAAKSFLRDEKAHEFAFLNLVAQISRS